MSDTPDETPDEPEAPPLPSFNWRVLFLEQLQVNVTYVRAASIDEAAAEVKSWPRPVAVVAIINESYIAFAADP